VLSSIPDVTVPAPYNVIDGARPAAMEAPTPAGFGRPAATEAPTRVDGRRPGGGEVPTPAETTNPDAVIPVGAKEAGRNRQWYVILGALLGAALLFVAGIGAQRVVGSAPPAPSATAAVTSSPAEEPVPTMLPRSPDSAVSVVQSHVPVGGDPQTPATSVPSAAAPRPAARPRSAPATAPTTETPHRPKARLETEL
jgi:hypothetical protein